MNHLLTYKVENPEEYLELSTVVAIGTLFAEYVELYRVNRHWIQQQSFIFDNIKRCKDNSPVDLEYMEELFYALCTQSFIKVIQKKKEELTMLPMRQWMDFLKEARPEAAI